MPVPAQKGLVTFEYCSLKGVPANDPTRIDEAPLEACADGSADWARLASVPVNTSGEAYVIFGVVRFTPVIGFRFRYRSGDIASGVSAARDFYWY